MTNIKFISIAVLIMLALLTSCSSNSSSSSSTSSSSSDDSTSIVAEKDPYEIMHIAFEGSPEVDKIKPLIEAVMNNYQLPLTNENKLKVGSMLVSLRKASAVGVTEMEILKHIYQHGSNKISLPDQAGISATLLETSK
jgi:hypothetical protein